MNQKVLASLFVVVILLSGFVGAFVIAPAISESATETITRTQRVFAIQVTGTISPTPIQKQIETSPNIAITIANASKIAIQLVDVSIGSNGTFSYSTTLPLGDYYISAQWGYY